MASLSTMRKWRKSVSVSANATLSSVAQATRTRRGISARRAATSREAISDAEAAATQMGQLMPGSAEKRIAAPRNEVNSRESHIK